MAGIFISYRKDDTRPWAINLHDRLVRTFDERQVFLDVDTITPGEWRVQIERALDKCQAVLVLIGQSWAATKDQEGEKRIFLPDDVHRAEVAKALARSNVTVIPVLVDGARVPQIHELPDDLKGLLERQFREIGDASDRRIADFDRLVRELEELTGQTKEKRMAVGVLLVAISVALANTMVRINSLAVALLFLALAICVLAFSAKVYADMTRERLKGAWPALAAAILSALMIVGFLVRLQFLDSHVSGDQETLRHKRFWMTGSWR
jgi:TIR domain